MSDELRGATGVDQMPVVICRLVRDEPNRDLGCQLNCKMHCRALGVVGRAWDAE